MPTPPPEPAAGAWQRFLHESKRPFPLLRMAAATAVALLVLVAGLYILTGQPFPGGHPVMAVGDSSMMHCSNGYAALGSQCEGPWGRLGTADPGDFVFLKRVKDVGDVSTALEGKERHYGGPGDVLAFSPWRDRSPIVHRALFFLVVHDNGTFSVPELGLDHVATLDQPQLVALARCDLSKNENRTVPKWRWESGFVTDGDDNPRADQCGGVLGPVPLAWIKGVARGEVPWLGVPSLMLRELAMGRWGPSDVPQDCKVMFFGLVATVAAVGFVAWRKSRKPGKQVSRNPVNRGRN